MERSVENIRNIRNVITAIFTVIILVVGLGAIYHMVVTEFSFDLGIGEAIIGIATLILACATFYLAFIDMEEGVRNRVQSELEARRDRRRLRLKEQLEGLYSPLIAYLDLLSDKSQHLYREGEVMPLMLRIKTKYEFLAEPDLRELLIEYYNTNLSALSDQEWDEIITPIIECIGNDNADLSKEYSELTSQH